MKYLKKYKIFESEVDNDQYLYDICQELVDIGMKVVTIKSESKSRPNDRYLIVKFMSDADRKNGISWDDLKEYPLRIKDYLGERYKMFEFRKVESYRNHSGNPFEKININDDTVIDGKILAFAIKYIVYD